MRCEEDRSLEALVLRRRELYDEQLRIRCGRYGVCVRVSHVCACTGAGLRLRLRLCRPGHM